MNMIQSTQDSGEPVESWSIVSGGSRLEKLQEQSQRVSHHENKEFFQKNMNGELGEYPLK